MINSLTPNSDKIIGESLSQLCAACGHLKETHSKMMGCMARGKCNYHYDHYCICDNFMEITNEKSAGSKDNEAAGQAL